MKKRFMYLAMSLCLVLAWVSFPVPATAAPAVIHVDANADGDNNGSSWEDAYTDLQDALDDAQAGDRIWVAEGIYKPTDGMLREATFAMKDWVEIYGGFDGSETTLSERNPDPASNGTILSGDIGTTEDNSDNAYHVVTVGSSVTSSAVLDGFTITAGNADGPGSYSFGAGLYNRSSSRLTLTNCAFSDNLASDNGAGMYNNDSINLTLTNCTFSGNSADSYGGGMYNYASSVTLTGCTFSNNSATKEGGGMSNYQGSTPTLIDCNFSGNSSDSYGGGMYCLYSTPTLTGCTFNGNSAVIQGGGMHNFSSSPTLTDCTFSGNFATDPGGDPAIDSQGGGMYNRDSSNPTLTGCTFSGNSSDYSGGGMFNYNNSNPTLTDCTFSDNSTAYWGGGMINFGSSPTLTDCTFINNSTEDGYYGDGGGGGMYNYEGSNATLTNCTFSSNSAAGFGGGVGNESSNPTLAGCTFSDNSSNNYGGGMGNYNGGNPVITNCTFSGNTSNTYGGGMGNYNGGNPILTNCTFSDNSAQYGGGMGTDSSNPDLTNCIFSGNSAQLGGGMYNELSSPELINCTLSGNSASTDGGGVYNFDSSSPTMTNCILWGNGGTAKSDQIYSYINSEPAVNYCCVQGWTTGGMGNIGEDPIFIDAAGGNLRLSAGSPCIDSGTDDGAPVEDIEGSPRPIDGDGDSTATTDMGAYESEYLNGLISVTSTPEGADFTISGPSSYSGMTPWSVSDAPAGEYTITWEELEGYTKPSGETKELADGGSISFTGNYVQHVGTIDATSIPDGANFTISGPASYSGTTSDTEPWSVSDAPIGEYTIVWGDLDGYTKPSDETKELANGESISFAGNYVQQVGTIEVTSVPDGASFTLSGAASYSGTTPWSMSDAPVGEYTIAWGDLEVFTKPSGETKDLTNEGSISFVGNYVQQEDSIVISSTPNGASFTISGAASYSGTTPWSVSDAPAGEYTIAWGDLDGYTKPSEETKELIFGGNVSFDGNYVQQVGTIEVTSTPDEATFNISGPASYSGTTSDETPWSVSDAPIGEYTITWEDLDGYTKPSEETKELIDGESISFDGIYVEISAEAGTIEVTSTPDGATFTISGPASYSGTTSDETPWSVSDAPVGEYTITWGEIEGYDTPDSQTYTLAQGDTISFQETYESESGGGGLSGGAIAGIVVGACAGLAVILLALRKWVFKS